MERPDIENYKLGKGFNTHDFVSDLTLYIDQLEAERKSSDWVEKIFNEYGKPFTSGRHLWEWLKKNCIIVLKSK